MKRILFLVSSMQGGGAERVAALLSNHWTEQGHEVTLMPTFSGRGDCLYPLDERVRLDYLADRVGSRSRSPLNKLRRLIELRGAIRELAPDVIVSFLSHVNVAAIVAAWGLGVPVVVSERTYPPMQSVGVGLQVLRRLLYPQASAIVMQTKRGHDWLAAMAPKAPGRIIPNPVVYPLPTNEPQIAPDAVVPHDRKVLLAVGRLVEEKRFEWIIDGFAEIAGRHSRWNLVILGEGVERGALEGLVQKKGLGTRVHLPGRVGNLADWYRRADLYVLSSRFEGFPNTLVEAMAHGLPAVSVDCDTGPRDIINHDVDGWLVAADDDARPLAYALDMLLSDPERCARLGQAAVAVRERFSIERIADHWDRVLERV